MIQENHINIDQEVMFDLIKYKLVLLFDHIKKDKNRQTHVDQNQNNDPPCVDLKFIIIYFKFFNEPFTDELHVLIQIRHYFIQFL